MISIFKNKLTVVLRCHQEHTILSIRKMIHVDALPYLIKSIADKSINMTDLHSDGNILADKSFLPLSH